MSGLRAVHAQRCDRMLDLSEQGLALVSRGAAGMTQGVQNKGMLYL